jgi:hypothetical protein
MSVSKMRSIAANGNSRVIPAQAGIQEVARMSVSKMRSIAAKHVGRRRARAGARRVGQGVRPKDLPPCLLSVPAQAGI